MQRLVVVGGGLGGHRALLAARELGYDGQVVLISGERHRPYDRPPLSKEMLASDDDGGRHFYPCEDLEHVEWKLGSPAIGLDPVRQTVTLADGEAVGYDGLVIATGRRARPWPGPVPAAGLFMIRDLDDAVAMRAAVTEDSNVVIVGAGFIGLEAAATFVQRGTRSVTVVGNTPHVLPVIGAEAAASVQRIHQDRGVTIRCGVNVDRIEGTERVEAVVLEGGERLPADVVLVAIGSVPNSEWLAGSGIELLDGNVVCDEFCAVQGAANVMAVGDVVAWPHPYVGELVAIEHWAIARDMAPIAVGNLLGVNTPPKAMATVPTFWSDQFDVKMKSAGFLSLATSFKVIEEDVTRPSLVVEAFRGEELVAAVAFNKNKAIIGYQRRLAELVGQRVNAPAK
ncbi:NAD(P)/FAD-dependent oxidoreductase [Nocardia sp. NPDC059246]|uniref:NAD(P)/FAD-dependent oxidoreductase n=1 Tax=unclassified Nocardia TaxID=2637762 RepID=UPI0036CD5339